MMQLLASPEATQSYDALFWLVAVAFVIIFAAMCLYGRAVDRRHNATEASVTDETAEPFADSKT